MALAASIPWTLWGSARRVALAAGAAVITAAPVLLPSKRSGSGTTERHVWVVAHWPSLP